MTAPSQQKLKVHGPVVVTANRLGDGAVVYRAALGGWTTRLDAAEVVTNTQDAKKLLAAAAAQDLEAVGPAIAKFADCYSFGDIRVGHAQNLVLPHVLQRDLPVLWEALDRIGVATPNVGLVSDIMATPARVSEVKRVRS